MNSDILKFLKYKKVKRGLNRDLKLGLQFI